MIDDKVRKRERKRERERGGGGEGERGTYLLSVKLSFLVLFFRFSPFLNALKDW